MDPESEQLKMSVHSAFAEYGEDFSGIMVSVSDFLEGDCGNLTGEDEILGFLSNSLQGVPRHGVYETKKLGRIHVLGDDAHVYVYPDLVYASESAGWDCSINTCTCDKTHTFAEEDSE